MITLIRPLAKGQFLSLEVYSFKWLSLLSYAAKWVALRVGERTVGINDQTTENFGIEVGGLLGHAMATFADLVYQLHGWGG